MDIRSRRKWWDLQVVKPDAASMAKSGQPPARSFTIGMDANSVDKLSSGPLASLLHRKKSNMLTYFIRIFQD